MATTTIPRLNISLEPHLAETLQPLLPLLPHEIASNLESALAQAARDGKHGVALIPYQLLHTISAWSRSSAGVTALSSHIPPLDLHSYSMVSLLAGTRTSPERKFPHTHSGQKDHEAEAKREINDRRAVVAVINAMLSILGSGAAVWWAAERLSWRDEWKVLLALAAAIVVAASEGILYLIWDSRRSKEMAPTQQVLGSKATQVLGPKATKIIKNKIQVPTISDKVQPHSEISSSLHSTDAVSPNIQLHHNTRGLRGRSQRQV